MSTVADTTFCPGLLDAAEDSEPCVAGSRLNVLGKRVAVLQTAWAARVKTFRLPPQRLGRYEFKTARTDRADAVRWALQRYP